MEAGLNNHLKKIASELFIKTKSLERYNIDRSLEILVKKIDDYFGDEVSKITVFGSYTRDTILPRRYDEQSDIDILVEFDTDEYEKLKPESYRSKLKRFAEESYPAALSVKDHPSVVIELNHIKFDLVPAIFSKWFFWSSIEIPNKKGGWMKTEPEAFNEELTKANKKYNSIVKPIVRLLKYWNACNGYPYYSYELEVAVADMDFSGDNVETGFFYAIKQLSTWDLPDWAEDAVDRLKRNAKQAKSLIKDGELEKAKMLIGAMLPES
jgi:predicted nucleotidyltransferase